MAGRPAKPIELHLKNGNKRHLTKAEIEHRKESEIKLGKKELLCPAYVKNDMVAFSKWRELKNIFKDIDFVSSGDVGLIGRYCMTWSEYQASLKTKKQYETDRPNDIETILKLGAAINKNMDALTKMEDRLFLSPLSKVRNVPKKEKVEEDKDSYLFGD